MIPGRIPSLCLGHGEALMMLMSGSSRVPFGNEFCLQSSRLFLSSVMLASLLSLSSAGAVESGPQARRQE